LTGGRASPIQPVVSARDPHDPAPSSAPAYARAGVDLDHDEGFVDQIKGIARGTLRPEILSGIGGFAGLFKTPDRYREPILVASTDGVGTKLKLAAQIGRFDTIGIDCVAMVVNDLVVQGAEPLVFLDYLAMGKLDTAQAREALKGVAEGCRRAGCALLGGETATMPGIYPPGEIELVGFGVGVVERSNLIDGSSIRAGDVLLGLGASGFHSNGYSLVRQVAEASVAAGRLEWMGENQELNTTLASALLAPTRIYVKSVLNLMRSFPLHGIVHITGGGFVGNVPRVLPQTVRAVIDPTSWSRPAVMSLIQRHGGISEGEMLRVFNCGIGMILVVPADAAEEIAQRLSGMGERVFRIGHTEQKTAPDEPSLVFDPAPRDPA